MQINIESGDDKSARKVRITGDGMEPVEFSAANLTEAHKTIAKGRKEGWNAIRPADLAVQTKADAAAETARVETGKKLAEPKARP